MNDEYQGMSLREFAWCLRRGLQELDILLLDLIISSEAPLNDVAKTVRKSRRMSSDRFFSAVKRLIRPVTLMPKTVDYQGDPLRLLIMADEFDYFTSEVMGHTVLRPGQLGQMVFDDLGPPEIEWEEGDIRGIWSLDNEIIHILSWVHAVPGIAISKLVKCMDYHPLVEHPWAPRGSKGKVDLSLVDRGNQLTHDLFRPCKWRKFIRPPLIIDVHSTLGIVNRSRLVLTAAGEYVVSKFAGDPVLIDGKIPPPPEHKPTAENWEW